MNVVNRAVSDEGGRSAVRQEECRCPVRPYYTMGSLASGSAHETALVRRWEAEHGAHSYAQARDELARQIQYAQGSVRSGDAVLDMVADVFGTTRRSEADRMSAGV